MTSGLPGNGRLLQLVAVGHAVVGALVYRRELRQIRRDGIFGAVPYKGPKATAFWFLLSSPLCWILGGLLHRAEEAGDAEVIREASRASLVTAALAIACMPISGFWAWLGISIRGLARARRMEP